MPRPTLSLPILALVLATPLGTQDVPYRVVIHVSNPVARITREQASQIFLRKVTLWDNRQPVLPVDQAPGSPVRRTFTKQIHRRTIASVQPQRVGTPTRCVTASGDQGLRVSPISHS